MIKILIYINMNVFLHVLIVLIPIIIQEVVNPVKTFNVILVITINNAYHAVIKMVNNYIYLMKVFVYLIAHQDFMKIMMIILVKVVKIIVKNVQVQIIVYNAHLDIIYMKETVLKTAQAKDIIQMEN